MTIAVGSRVVKEVGDDREFYWRICYKGKKELVKVDDSSIYMADSNYVYLAQRGENGAEFREDMACALDIILTTINTRNRELEKHGIVIDYWDWGYESDYSYSTYCNVTISNTGNKTIKYIWFDFIAYDAVEERLTSFGKRVEKVKGIGPIETGFSGTYNFDSVFHSRVVETMSIASITIQYMDGTKKTIADPKKIMR